MGDMANMHMDSNMGSMLIPKGQKIRVPLEGFLGAPSRARGNSVMATFSMGSSTSELEICYSLPSGSTHEDANRLFPEGANIRIKDVQKLGPGRLVVHSPSSVDLLGIPGCDKESPKSLRLLGNAAFSRGDVVLAGLYYKECMSRYRNNNVNKDENLLLASSNMVQVHLRLRNFDGAILDASKVLEMDPAHVKCLVRQAKALGAVQDHEAALVCLNKAKQAITGKQEVQDMEVLIQNCYVLVNQAKFGNHDISGYLKSGFHRDRVPEFADYVGPVKVDATKDGRGRGLFATRDAKMGDLLMVSNPIGFVQSQNFQNIGFAMELVTECMRNCRGSSRLQKQIENLAKTGINNWTVPSMEFYMPNCGTTFGDVKVDLDGTTRAVSRCSYDFFPDPSWDKRQKGYLGLWGLPSFANHSCTPNIWFHIIGETVFTRASRDIQAGEELTNAYIDVLWPLETRKELLTPCFFFRCKCSRCAFEDEMQLLHLKRISVSDLDKVDMAIVGCSQQQKEWVRASFVKYFAAAGNVGRDRLVQAACKVAPGRVTTLCDLFLIAFGSFGTARKLDTPERGVFLRQCIACFGHQQADTLERILNLFEMYPTEAMYASQGLDVFSRDQ